MCIRDRLEVERDIEHKIIVTATDTAGNSSNQIVDIYIQDPLTGQTFNLDVDGDGTVGAFSDGFMVLRKMFGDAFADDALTNKAITSTATRTTSEIHQYIQEGIDNKILDVDGDGEVGAFSDGFMILRKMFGDAFAGEALTLSLIHI